jgi:hypothetical protein
MIIEKIEKEFPPTPDHVITMTRDEAVALIAGLVKFLNEDPNKFDGSVPRFLEGSWWQNNILFTVVPEKQYLEHLYELRKDKE